MGNGFNPSPHLGNAKINPLNNNYCSIWEMEESEECSVTPPDPTIQFVLEQVTFMQV